MRISEYYNLNRSQPTLDFVDVDIRNDLPFFIDPRALRLLPSVWGEECVALIQNFFHTVLELIKDGNDAYARQLLEQLREPNETHLGFSQARSQGRGLGHHSAADVWLSLTKSQAVRTGLLEDLEDTILMVEGISSDIISDITTNIIRAPLIEYTQSMAKYYNIPLVPDVESGPVWDPHQQMWVNHYVMMPCTPHEKLLLVPKAIVRQKIDYDVEEYYRHYILTYLQQVEINANSALVRLLKDGSPRVTKKDLEQKYGRGKGVIVQETLKYPDILQRYRTDKNKRIRPPLDHRDLAISEGTSLPEWDKLLQDVLNVPLGRDSFSRYEQAIEALLTTLFYPSLTNPRKQYELHEGRKRIDLTYTNVAQVGFFDWLSKHYAAANIFIECKNYVADPANPELDQMAGRFSPSRGQIGIITCRQFTDKRLFLRRCRDTAYDQRGFILVIDDNDLQVLVDERKNGFNSGLYTILQQQFDALIS